MGSTAIFRRMAITTVKRFIIFDPRIQLIIALITSVIIIIAEDAKTILYLVGFMGIYLILQGLIKETMYFFIATSLLFLFYLYSLHSNFELLTVLGFLFYIGFQFMPVMMSVFVLFKNPTGKLLVALHKMYIPVPILLILAVIARYFPLMKVEYQAIQLTARLRGISVHSWRNWLKPLQTYEYAMVPLMMRSLKIADELAATATVRGIDCPHKKTSIYQIEITWQDIVLCITFLLMMISLFMEG